MNFELTAYKRKVSKTDAETNTTTEVTETAPKAIFNDFHVNTDVKQQADLLYATYPDVAPKYLVQLQFHHALCQVVFRSIVENPNINVAIKEVGFYSLYTHGDFVWPNTADYENITSAESQIRDTDMADEMTTYKINRAGDDAAGLAISERLKGKIDAGWFLHNGDATRADYMVKLEKPVSVEHSDANAETKTYTWLTKAPADHTAKDGWNNVLQLMPQRSTGVVSFAQASIAQANAVPQVPQGVLTILGKPARRGMRVQHNISAMNGLFNIPEIKEGETPVYIKLCADITTTDAYGKTVTLWSSTEADGETPKYFYVPVSIYWEPGYRYIYTLNFTKEGSGGKPTTDPNDPNTVLNNIFVGVNVDEYTEVEVKEAENNDGDNGEGGEPGQAEQAKQEML